MSGERQTADEPAWAVAGIGAGSVLRTTAAAATLAALAALGVVTGPLARAVGSLAAGALLAAATGAVVLVMWQLYARPAARSARLLAAAAASMGPPDPSLEAAAAAVLLRVTDLERASERLFAVISGLPQGVLLFRRDGALEEINHTAANMLGVNTVREGAGGGRVSAAMAALEEHHIGAVTEPALYHGDRGEADLQIGDRWLQAQSQPFVGADGEHGALVVLQDVTRLRRLEQVRRDFVANVSHELRTPVTSITGFVETLLDNEMCNGAEAHRFLRIIQKQSTRLGAIIEDLLSLADIELGEERSSIEFEDSALAPVISVAIQACEQIAVARGIAVEAACSPDLTCRMNAQLVEQALINLIDNAIKHSSRDTQVTVRAQRGTGGVVVEVIDTGAGIAVEHQERIFERFYRVDRARSSDHGGTGLGLAIVRHVAQAHDGEVSVRSAANRGSTFTLRLPG